MFPIRPLEKRDYPQLLSLFMEFSAFQKKADEMKNSVESMEEESDLLNAFVVETDSGQIIGYATYFYAYFTWSGKSLYMDDLYVKPDFRGKGLGKKLLNSIIDLAKQEKCKKIHWQVARWNANAIEFYQNLGAEVDDMELNCDYWLIKR
ncbi:MAG: GNAT family N-acetyltransferase [Bacteroidales bacterium]|jgi:diamine N-acetyltransferase|nr:GNAT family N-acetyltransferase [Bacteroidales bacterium]